MAVGTTRVVPPLDARQAITELAHLTSGHFGARRTAHLLLINYWWPGVLKQAQDIVWRCEVCDRVKALFDNLLSWFRYLLRVCSTVGAWTCVAHFLSQIGATSMWQL